MTRTFRFTSLPLAAFGAAMLVAAPAANAAEVPAAAKKLLAAAQAEGKIKLSWGGSTLDGSKGAKRFARGFNKHYGTNIKFNFTPGGSFTGMARKLTQEFAAGKEAFQDVVLSGTGNSAQHLIKAKALHSVDWGPLAPHIPASLIKKLTSPNNELITFISKSYDIAYNTNFVSKADSPKRLTDLLNPKWKGKISTTPYAAGFPELIYHKDWGEKRLLEWARGLTANLGGLMRCGEHDRITSGEFWIFALACETDRMQAKIAKGAPLGFNIALDVMNIQHWTHGVPKHSKHPNVAKLYIAYVLTSEGQKIVYRNQGADLHYFKGSKIVKLFKAAEKAAGHPMHDQTLRVGLKQKTYKAFKALTSTFRTVKKKK